jgi:two-component system, response regulator RpfG
MADRPAPALRDILVVDDSPSNTTLYERVVNHIQGHAAQCFTDPVLALAWAKTHRAALVVVDYKMPKMDGLEFIRRLRAMEGNEHVPIAMLTAVHSPVLWQMALDAGASAYLMKPIDKQQFIETAQRLLGAAPHK